MSGGERILETLFSIIIFAMLCVSPIVIMNRYNEYMKSCYVEDRMKDYLEDVVVDDLTLDNYTAFLYEMSELGMSIEVSGFKGGDYYTPEEIIDILKVSGNFGLSLGDYIEVKAYDNSVILFETQVIGEN